MKKKKHLRITIHYKFSKIAKVFVTEIHCQNIAYSITDIADSDKGPSDCSE